MTALTPRECEYMELVCQGLNNAEIADALCVARGSTGAMLSKIYLKLGARNRVVAALMFAGRELRLLRELRADVERWNESGGDVRDLRYVFETLEKLREQFPQEQEVVSG
jgi:DNA-binding CsgD family transcriptional regulator